MKRALLCVCCATSVACVPSTGGNLVGFTLEAGGDPRVVNGGPLTFHSPRGFDVTLTRAQLKVGGVYFNQQNPQNYTLEASCVQPGIYTGEVRAGLTLNLLDPTPQPFPVQGNGTDRPTLAAELWLTGTGDVLAEEDRTVILDLAGTASRGMDHWPFDAALTIGSNRAIPPRNPALPGSNPLCQQRIVAPIPFEATLADQGTVRLWVDPRAYFASVDFSALTRVQDLPVLYRFSNDGESTVQPDRALYSGLRAAVGPYRFEVAP